MKNLVNRKTIQRIRIYYRREATRERDQVYYVENYIKRFLFIPIRSLGGMIVSEYESFPITQRTLYSPSEFKSDRYEFFLGDIWVKPHIEVLCKGGYYYYRYFNTDSDLDDFIQKNKLYEFIEI